MRQRNHPTGRVRAWPAYRLAMLDRDFLLSPAMRGVRL